MPISSRPRQGPSPPDPIDQVADDDHERVHADEVRGDDREHGVVLVLEMVHYDGPGEGHHRDHHAEARLARDERRDDSGPPEELADRRSAPRRLHGLVRHESRDPLRVRAHRCDEGQPDELERRRGEPELGERAAIELTSRQHRAEDERTEDRAEHRTEEHERDPAPPALRRIHIAPGGPREQGGAVRDPDPDQAGNYRRRGVVCATQGGEAATCRTDTEARGEHRDTAEPIHRAPGRDGRKRPGGEHDRGPETKEPLHLEHASEADGGDGGRQLEHRRVRSQRGGKQRDVPPNRKHHAASPDSKDVRRAAP